MHLYWLCRFISRYGYVQEMRSHNVTNLLGATKELKSCVRQLDPRTIIRCLSQNEITWIFNPPVSPRMDRIWESLIKSVKHSLKAIKKVELSPKTAFIPFYMKLNPFWMGDLWQPLAMILTDPELLTPNHLLIGSSSLNLSTGNFNSNEIN